jgi:type I restriction enzyme, S subunit
MILKEVCELIVDCEHKTANIQSEGCPSIRTPNIGPGYLILEGVNRVSDETYRKWTARAIPQYGDLIMAREAPVGNVAMIPRGLQVCLGQRTLLIRPIRDKVDPRFLVYLLLGEEVQGVIHGMTNGATVPHLNMKDVRALPLPILPELLTQRKIAAILSAYDDLIENNLRRIKILEEMAQNLYREWFVKFRVPGHEQARFVDSPLGMIPEGWEVAEFRYLFNVKYGKTLPKTKIETVGSYPVYGAGNIIGYYDKALCVKKCALITSRGNGSGTVWRTRQPAFVTNNSLIILPTEEFDFWDYSFVELLLKHSNVMEAKTGSAQPQVTIENLNYVKAIVPESHLVKKFCSFVTPISEQVDLYLLKNDILRRTRDMLLPKLISGEVDVSDLDITIPEEAAA